MSVEELQDDLRSLGEKLKADPPASVAGVVLWMQNELLPWLDNFTKEAEEIDEAVEDIVHQSAEILHQESGEVFAALIASGLAIATELVQRAGNDQRLLKIVREFREKAAEGKDILEEIVIEDPDEEEPDEEPEDKPAIAAAQEGPSA